MLIRIWSEMKTKTDSHLETQWDFFNSEMWLTRQDTVRGQRSGLWNFNLSNLFDSHKQQEKISSNFKCMLTKCKGLTSLIEILIRWTLVEEFQMWKKLQREGRDSDWNLNGIWTLGPEETHWQLSSSWTFQAFPLDSQQHWSNRVVVWRWSAASLPVVVGGFNPHQVGGVEQECAIWGSFGLRIWFHSSRSALTGWTGRSAAEMTTEWIQAVTADGHTWRHKAVIPNLNPSLVHQRMMWTPRDFRPLNLQNLTVNTDTGGLQTGSCSSLHLIFIPLYWLKKVKSRRSWQLRTLLTTPDTRNIANTPDTSESIGGSCDGAITALTQ